MVETLSFTGLKAPKPKKPQGKWYFGIFILGWLIGVVLLSAPAFILENALLQKPLTGRFADFVYVLPRISIAADRAADSDPFFSKVRQQCGTASVAERSFRSYHTVVHRLDDRPISFDKSGHARGMGSTGAGASEIARAIRFKEFNRPSQSQLDCMEKVGDPNVQFIESWLDFGNIEAARHDANTVATLSKRMDDKARLRRQAWLATHPLGSANCDDADLPRYFVCDGVPGSVLTSLANIKAREGCREKDLNSPRRIKEINQYILLALPRLNEAGRRALLRALPDERSQLGDYFNGTCPQ